MRQEFGHVRPVTATGSSPVTSKNALQVERPPPAACVGGTGRHQLQLPVHQPVTNRARTRHETRKTLEAAHFSTIPARDARTLERHGHPCIKRYVPIATN